MQAEQRARARPAASHDDGVQKVHRTEQLKERGGIDDPPRIETTPAAAVVPQPASNVYMTVVSISQG